MSDHVFFLDLALGEHLAAQVQRELQALKDDLQANEPMSAQYHALYLSRLFTELAIDLWTRR